MTFSRDRVSQSADNAFVKHYSDDNGTSIPYAHTAVWSFMILCLHTCLVYFSIFGNAGSKEHYAAVRRDGAAPRQYAFLDPIRGALKSYEGSIFHLPPAWILQSRHFPGLRRKCDWRVPPPRFYRAPRYAWQNLCREKITTKLKNFRELQRSSSRFASRGTSSSDSRASDSCDRSDSSSSRRAGAFRGEIQAHQRRYRGISAKPPREGDRMTTSLSVTICRRCLFTTARARNAETMAG